MTSPPLRLVEFGRRVSACLDECSLNCAFSFPRRPIHTVVPAQAQMRNCASGDPSAAADVMEKEGNAQRCETISAGVWVPAQGRDDTDYLANSSASTSISRV